MSNWGNEFRGKVAIVTGAASGIGLATAEEYAREGAKVVACDINGSKCEKWAEGIRASGGDAIGLRVDVSLEEDIDEMIDRAMDEYGKIDILVNNAGINPFSPFVVQTTEDFDRVMNVNAKGIFLAVKAVLPIFIDQGGGVIVNVTSIMSMVAGFGQAPYNASKGAAKMLTQGIAVDCADYNIRCNAVAPGMVETGLTNTMFSDEQRRKWFVERIPSGRIGLPIDIANGILFLSSSKAQYINGTTLVIDGGMITTRG